MKTLFAILITVCLFGCSQSDKKSTTQKDSTIKDSTANASVLLKDAKLSTIYTSYIGLKNAFVASDSNSVKEKALLLNEHLTGYEGCESTALTAKKIADEKSLSLQRKDFTAVSSDLIALFKHADLSKGTIYIQHCPMANKGNGGDWLSSEKDVKNPYYGDEMLECGSVTEEIKAK